MNGILVEPPRDYSVIALQYASDVVAGQIPACQWVIRACQRQLNDLDRVGAVDFPYLFDEARASAVCQFIELLPHTKGAWAQRKKKIELEPWQVFFITTLFGWVHAETALRRFRKAYLCVPRKNGKSIIAGGIGLYMFAADGEHGAEVYSGATTEKQAWEVFRPARFMAIRTPEFVDAFDVSIGAKQLHIESDGSRFEPLIGNPGDGASPSCAIVDEYHEHETDSFVDTMETGMGSREQPLTLVITTAGSNLESPCYALQQDVQGILSGAIENDRILGMIYTIDDPEQWTTEAALRMANPNYDVSVSSVFLKARVAEAIQSARKQNTVKTKHLNIWCTARDAWMNMESWNACDDAPGEEEFDGQACFIGLDLASKIDLAAGVRVFRRLINNVTHYYGYGSFYLPEDRIEDSYNRNVQHYQDWALRKILTVTDGNVIDYETILADLKESGRRFDVQELVSDPHGATMLLQRLQSEGFTVAEFPQQWKFFSEPMKELEALVLSGRFHHDGNPALRWMVSNVVVKPDANENIFPRKERAEAKIDGAVALIMGLARAMFAPEPAPPPRITIMNDRGHLNDDDSEVW